MPIREHHQGKGGGALGRALLSATASALLAAGCANYAGIHSDKQVATVEHLETQQSLPAEGGAWPDAHWAGALGDPQLPRLIDEALANSPTLAQARARLDRAAAYTQGANARRFPRVDAHYALTRELFSANALYPPPYGGEWYTDTNGSLSASFELDLWGKNSAGLAQAISQEKAADAEQQVARLTLSASVARSYNELAREYALLDVAQREVSERESVNRITGSRVGAGLDTQVERRTSEANIATSRGSIAQLQGRIIATRYELAALLGKGPDRGLAIDTPRFSQLASPKLPDTVAADLISRRPDLVAARWRVDAASQGIKVSKADFYPNVNLAAMAGFESFGFGRFFERGSRQFQVGPAINLPIFDAGALRAQLRDRYATYDEAVADYNKTLLDALNDVATRIAAIHSAENQIRAAEAAYAAAGQAYQLAVIRYRGGLSTQLQVLSADSIRLAQEQTLVSLRADRIDQQVALIKALGGGFNDAAEVAQQGPGATGAAPADAASAVAPVASASHGTAAHAASSAAPLASNTSFD